MSLLSSPVLSNAWRSLLPVRHLVKIRSGSRSNNNKPPMCFWPAKRNHQVGFREDSTNMTYQWRCSEQSSGLFCSQDIPGWQNHRRARQVYVVIQLRQCRIWEMVKHALHDFRLYIAVFRFKQGLCLRTIRTVALAEHCYAVVIDDFLREECSATSLHWWTEL